MSSAAATTQQRVDRKEFRRVRAESAPKEKGQGPENLIRVTAQRGQRSYISYAIALLTGNSAAGTGSSAEEGSRPAVKQQDTIKVSGMGAAIFNAVNIAEIVKRRVKGLHQLTEISSETVKDSYEGIESKQALDVERKVATILITLSTKPLDSKHVGYQAPLPEDQVTEQEDRKPSSTAAGGERERRVGRGTGRGSGRGSGRGGRGTGRGASSRGGRGGSSGRGGSGAGKRDGDEKKAPAGSSSSPARGGAAAGSRGSGSRTRGSGRGAAAAASGSPTAATTTEKKAAGSPTAKAAAAGKASATSAEKAAKPDYDKLAAEAEDKLDRQKGEGHSKAKPSGQAKPKSVRASK